MSLFPHPNALLRTCAACFLSVFLTLTGQARAEVPSEQRVKILFTALGFHRTLAESPDFEVVVGIVGECATASVIHQTEGKKINGKPISVIRATGVTYAYLERSGINIVYLCQASEADTTILGKAAPRLGLTVLADDPNYVKTLALMGVREQDGRPKLLLNMKVARATNVELDPRILAAAEIVAE